MISEVEDMKINSYISKLLSRKWILAGIITILLITSGLITYFVVFYPEKWLDNLEYNAPILIESDEDFIKHDFSGEGTLLSPFVLEKKNITTLEETAIYIHDTMKYFIVRKCFLSAKTVGIRISDVTEGTATVEDIICSDCDGGIILGDAPSSKLKDNQLIDCDLGIRLIGSHSSIISNNYISNGGFSIYETDIENYSTYKFRNNFVNDKKLGFFTNFSNKIINEPIYGQIILRNSHHVSISNQIISETYTGIDIMHCSNISIESNILSRNIMYGILVWESDNLSFTNNTCQKNDFTGIRLVLSQSSSITNNTVSDNRFSGISISNSGNSEYCNNTIEGSIYGVNVFKNSDNIIFRNNTFRKNLHGLYIRTRNFTLQSNLFFGDGLVLDYEALDNLQNQIIEDNMINNKPLAIFIEQNDITINESIFGQVILYKCSDFIIQNIEISNTSIGIFSKLTSNLTITNSVIQNCYYGLRILSSPCSNLSLNQISCNFYGQYVSSCGSSTIENNIIESNEFGLTLSFLNDGFVINNSFERNADLGLLIENTRNTSFLGNSFTNDGVFISFGCGETPLGKLFFENNTVNNLSLGFFEKSNGLTISSDSFGQLILLNCTDVKIENQILNKTSIGILLMYSRDLVVKNTISSYNSHEGIYLQGCSNFTIRDSSFCYNNGSGIYSRYPSYGPCPKNFIYNNNITNNQEKGIYFNWQQETTLYNNIITNNNEEGISLISSYNCSIFHNNLIRNQKYGVSLISHSDYNVIYENNFLDNNLLGNSQAFEDYSENNTWYNPLLDQGNWWSDYNGLGEYLIDGNSKSIDPYPLQNPIIPIPLSIMLERDSVRILLVIDNQFLKFLYLFQVV